MLLKHQFIKHQTLNVASSATGTSNDEVNYLHKLQLSDTQVSRAHKTFTKDPSTNVKFSKTQLSKMVQ